MPHFKATIFKLLAAGISLSTAPPAFVAADGAFDSTKAGVVVDVWPEGKMPGRGAREPEGERPPKGDNVRRITNVSRPTLTVFPAPETSAPAGESFHIYLLTGQSNMAGRDTRALASQVDNLRVLAPDGEGRWVIARDPIHARVGRIAPGVGPGIPFALEMLKADPRVTIGLVPCAVGGTPLRRWVKGADLYEQAVSRARAAAKAGVIKGVLWHQGEADTTKKENAETYEARLTQMFRDLRQDLGVPALPIVVGQLGDFLTLTPEKNPYAETVRAAIRRVPAVMPGVGYADSAGLGDKGDKLHFSADAQKELGARFARAMRALQK